MRYDFFLLMLTKWSIFISFGSWGILPLHLLEESSMFLYLALCWGMWALKGLFCRFRLIEFPFWVCLIRKKQISHLFPFWRHTFLPLLLPLRLFKLFSLGIELIPLPLEFIRILSYLLLFLFLYFCDLLQLCFFEIPGKINGLFLLLDIFADLGQTFWWDLRCYRLVVLGFYLKSYCEILLDLRTINIKFLIFE